MLKRIDRKIVENYGYENLRHICNVNIKLVPEPYIIRIKNALSLQCPAVESSCCHSFLGWDVAHYAYQRNANNPLDKLFEIMKGTYQPSCSPECGNPDLHFREYTAENKCFPLNQVFMVLLNICPNAANQLLDGALIEIIYKQIKEKEGREQLLIYQIKRNHISKFSNFIRRITKQGFRILIVDFDMLSLEAKPDYDVHDNIKDNFDNIVDNIKRSFDYTVAPKPAADKETWEAFIDYQIQKDSDAIVAVLSQSVVQLICKWSPRLIDTKYISIEENQLDDNVKYQYLMFKKLSKLEKLKIAVIFDDTFIGDIMKMFPFTFVLPKEMKNLLYLLEEISNGI